MDFMETGSCNGWLETENKLGWAVSRAKLKINFWLFLLTSFFLDSLDLVTRINLIAEKIKFQSIRSEWVGEWVSGLESQIMVL